MLTKKQIKHIQEELDTAQNPLFFFDDDPDGVCSFVTLYKRNREGRGIIVKASPVLDIKYFRKVEENNPDKIFILDKPMVQEEFIDKAKRPVFWIDHHDPCPFRQKLNYYNPRIKDPSAYIPTTRMTYQIHPDPENMWIAMVGCLGDWYMPDFAEEFSKNHPNLLPKVDTLKNAVYKHPIGKLVRIVSFILKGPLSDVKKSIKILTRIKYPEEILNQETSQGKFIYRRYEGINQIYEKILTESKKKVTSSKLLIVNYQNNKWSFTADLANELTNTYPKKVIIIARNNNGEMKCSLRGQKPIRDALTKALDGIEGYGGGHENACGAVIKDYDWEKFLGQFKRELKNR